MPTASQQTNSRSKENKSKKPAVVQEENKFVQSTNKGRLVILNFYNTYLTQSHINIINLSKQFYFTLFITFSY